MPPEFPMINACFMPPKLGRLEQVTRGDALARSANATTARAELPAGHAAGRHIACGVSKKYNIDNNLEEREMMNSGKILAAISGATLVLGLAAGHASACQDKTDCSAGEICCFGGFQADTGTTLGQAEARGYCAKASVCQRESGSIVIYGDGSDCADGTSIKTITTSDGTEVTGCFP